MKKIIRYNMIFLFFFNSCSNEPIDIVSSDWIFDFGDCQDKIKFQKDSDYEFYSCETDSKYFGKYFIEDNFLILEQTKGEYDDNFKSNSVHRVEHIKFRLIIKKDSLKFIERWELIDGKWEKSSFKFDEDYVLIRH